MRIISGKYRGRKLNPPKGLPVRPTMDQSREALFNILQNRFYLPELKVLDLFAGTGSMTYEFVSRGVESVTAVDRNWKCVQFIKTTLQELKVENATVIKAPVEGFLKRCQDSFDLVFMDPPYAMPGQQEMVQKLLESDCLASDGTLILEHDSAVDVSGWQNWEETREYGGSSFSFFSPSPENTP